MAVGVAEVHPLLRGMIQLVRRPVVAHPVPPVIGEPELLRLGMPVEPHRIAHTPGEDLQCRPVPVHPHDGSIAGICTLADVAGGAHGDVEQTVGPEPDEFPAVVPVLRKAVIDDDRRGRIGETGFDPIVPQDTVDLGDVQGIPHKSNAVGRVEPLRHGDHLIGDAIPVPVEDGIDLPLSTAAHEQGAFGAEGHRPRAGDVPGINSDPESRRQGDGSRAAAKRRTTTPRASRRRNNRITPPEPLRSA